MKIEKQNCEHLEKSQVLLGPPGWSDTQRASAVHDGGPRSPQLSLELCPDQHSHLIPQHLLFSILIFRMKHPDVDLHPHIKTRRGSRRITTWKKLASKK